MERRQLEGLLAAVQRGECPVEEALERLRALPFEDLGFARLDHHRELRTGFPEVVFAEGKSTDHLLGIVERLVASGVNVLVTRLAAAPGALLAEGIPGFEYHALARVGRKPGAHAAPAGRGSILVISAGTADLAVAEEAALSAEIMGNSVERLFDVGVSGLHRLLESRERLWQAGVIIVVAGMEGALPSVVGGMVRCPVVAVPTSVGYGASFGGLAALLGMLNTCSAGVVVVNIDNGFGAAAAASRITHG